MPKVMRTHLPNKANSFQLKLNEASREILYKIMFCITSIELLISRQY